MAPSETTIAEILKQAGYATFFAGKWHLGPKEEFWPEAQGYDVNIGGHHAGGPYTGGKYFSPFRNPRMEDRGPGEHLPDRLAEETAAFIGAHRDRPFFAFLSFYSVHTPLMGRPDLVEKYRRKAQAIEGEEFGPEEQAWPVPDPRRVRLLQKHAVYAAMVEAMDAAVGKVLAALDRHGLAERSAVIFMSDNGGLSTSEGSPTSNLPYRGGKGWLYEGGLREPFLLRWPGVTRPGSACDVPVVSTDFFPTLLDIAGLPLRPDLHLDGISLAPLLHGRGTHDRDAIFWHYPHYSNQGGFPGSAVRSGDWKLIQRIEDGRVQLFNLKTDPGEREDLAETEPQRTRELQARLHAWYRETGARFLRAKDGREPWRPSN
jgi:arylsulfatase A-like enzyme